MDKFVAAAGPIGTVLNAFGAIKSGNAAADAGRAQQLQAEYQAQQLEQNAGQDIATGQRAAAEQLRQARLLQSRALAVAAASGGGAMDPSVLNIIGGIDMEGKLAADIEMYNAKESARGKKDDARALRYTGQEYAAAGKETKRASRLTALTTVLGGAQGFKNAWGTWNANTSKQG